MTALNAARQSIYQRFITEWANTSPFTFDNEKFDPPDTNPWVRLTVRHTGSVQETLGRIGNRKFNRSGSILIQVFIATNLGTETSDDLVTPARNIFEGASFNGVYANNSVVREVGIDGRWFQTIIETFFFYDEIK